MQQETNHPSSIGNSGIICLSVHTAVWLQTSRQIVPNKRAEAAAAAANRDTEKLGGEIKSWKNRNCGKKSPWTIGFTGKEEKNLWFSDSQNSCCSIVLNRDKNTLCRKTVAVQFWKMSELQDPHQVQQVVMAAAAAAATVTPATADQPAAVPEIVSDQPVKKVIKGIMKNGGSSHQNSPTASGGGVPRKSW